METEVFQLSVEQLFAQMMTIKTPFYDRFYLGGPEQYVLIIEILGLRTWFQCKAAVTENIPMDYSLQNICFRFQIRLVVFYDGGFC